MSIDLKEGKYILTIKNDGSMLVWLPEKAQHIEFHSVDYLKTIKEISELILEHLDKNGLDKI